jgi:hypothetical protein
MIQIGATTFTGLYDPALNDHLSRALTLCTRRRNRNVVSNLPILSLDHFDGSFHNNTERLKRVDPFSPPLKRPTLGAPPSSNSVLALKNVC